MLPRLLQLPLPLLLLFSALVTSSASSAPSASSASPSPPATTELICHTSDSAECYPRLFQATQDFQVVKEDQDIPPGLHIRLNLETGKKEAKLYDDSPIDSSELAIALDDEGNKIETTDPPQDSQTTTDDKRIPPPYNPAGKIPVPKDSDEQKSFTTSLKILTSTTSPITNPAALLTALETLEELAHDLYYGSELTRAPGAVAVLISFIHPSVADADEKIRAAAALVLGSSLQNNPTALEHTLKRHADLMRDLIVALDANFDTPKVQEKLLYALSSLTRAPGQRGAFLSENGMKHMEKQFQANGAGSGDGRDMVRGKIGNFVGDYFVNDDMSAKGEKKVGNRVLRQWCEVFGTALQKWGQDGTQGCEGACEKVMSARKALDEKLGGCEVEHKEL